MMSIPGPLYEIVQLYHNEETSFRKVHRLIDAFEWAIKWHSVLVMADVLQSSQISDKLKVLFSSGLRTPSLGQWILFFRSVLEEGDSFSFPWLEWECLIRLENKHQIVGFRNEYAHGATPSEEVCAEHCLLFFPVLEQLLASPIFSELQLIVLEQGHTFRWVADQKYHSEVMLSQGTVGVVSQKSPDKLALYLWPFGTMMNEAQLIDKGSQFFYYNAMKNKSVEQLNYAWAVRRRDAALWSSMHEKYPLHTWRKISTPRLDLFREHVEALTENFQGRRRELQFIFDFCQKGYGTLMVWGGPGIGKSTLLAQFVRLAKDRRMKIVEEDILFPHPKDIPVVIPYFIRRGTDFALPEKFLKTLCSELDTLYGLVGLEFGFQTDVLSDNLRLRLQMISELEHPQKLVLFVDGLDEAIEERIGILRYIPKSRTWLTVLCASRKVETVQQWYRDRNHPQEYTIGPLSPNDIRAFLGQVISKYDLRLDNVIEIALKKSEGNPLYLKLLCDELRMGEITIDSLDTLPKEMEAMYKRKLDVFRAHEKADDIERALCIFSVAKKALDPYELSLFLGCSCFRAEGIINILIEFLYEDEAQQYKLFHESLRNFIVQERRRQCHKEQKNILAQCLEWRLIDPEDRVYPFSFGYRHALELGDYEALWTFASDKELRGELTATPKHLDDAYQMTQMMKEYLLATSFAHDRTSKIRFYQMWFAHHNIPEQANHTRYLLDYLDDKIPLSDIESVMFASKEHAFLLLMVEWEKQHQLVQGERDDRLYKMFSNYTKNAKTEPWTRPYSWINQSDHVSSTGFEDLWGGRFYLLWEEHKSIESSTTNPIPEPEPKKSEVKKVVNESEKLEEHITDSKDNREEIERLFREVLRRQFLSHDETEEESEEPSAEERVEIDDLEERLLDEADLIDESDSEDIPAPLVQSLLESFYSERPFSSLFILSNFEALWDGQNKNQFFKQLRKFGPDVFSHENMKKEILLYWSCGLYDIVLFMLSLYVKQEDVFEMVLDLLCQETRGLSLNEEQYIWLQFSSQNTDKEYSKPIYNSLVPYLTSSDRLFIDVVVVRNYILLEDFASAVYDINRMLSESYRYTDSTNFNTLTNFANTLFFLYQKAHAKGRNFARYVLYTIQWEPWNKEWVLHEYTQNPPIDFDGDNLSNLGLCGEWIVRISDQITDKEFTDGKFLFTTYNSYDPHDMMYVYKATLIDLFVCFLFKKYIEHHDARNLPRLLKCSPSTLNDSMRYSSLLEVVSLWFIEKGYLMELFDLESKFTHDDFFCNLKICEQEWDKNIASMAPYDSFDSQRDYLDVLLSYGYIKDIYTLKQYHQGQESPQLKYLSKVFAELGKLLISVPEKKSLMEEMEQMINLERLDEREKKEFHNRMVVLRNENGFPLDVRSIIHTLTTKEMKNENLSDKVAIIQLLKHKGVEQQMSSFLFHAEKQGVDPIILSRWYLSNHQPEEAIRVLNAMELHGVEFRHIFDEQNHEFGTIVQYYAQNLEIDNALALCRSITDYWYGHLMYGYLACGLSRTSQWPEAIPYLQQCLEEISDTGEECVEEAIKNIMALSISEQKYDDLYQLLFLQYGSSLLIEELSLNRDAYTDDVLIQLAYIMAQRVQERHVWSGKGFHFFHHLMMLLIEHQQVQVAKALLQAVESVFTMDKLKRIRVHLASFYYRLDSTFDVDAYLGGQDGTDNPDQAISRANLSLLQNKEEEAVRLLESIKDGEITRYRPTRDDYYTATFALEAHPAFCSDYNFIYSIKYLRKLFDEPTMEEQPESEACEPEQDISSFDSKSALYTYIQCLLRQGKHDDVYALFNDVPELGLSTFLPKDNHNPF